MGVSRAEGNTRSLVRSSEAASSTSKHCADSGTLCSCFAFILLAGTVQVAASRSTDPNVCALTLLRRGQLRLMRRMKS